jgi:hypothetical protein
MPNSSAVIMDNGRINNCGNAGIGSSGDEDGDAVGDGMEVSEGEMCTEELGEGVGVGSGVGIVEGQAIVNE